MGLGAFTEFLGYIMIWVSNFLFGINGIDGKYPGFGSFFSMLIFLWVLEGFGFIIRTIFGWNMEEAAAKQDNRYNPTPAHKRK